jgi:hypothetical protein
MSYRIEMGVLAEETDIKDWHFRVSFDGSFHTFWIEAVDQSWRMSFDFHDKTAPKVLQELDGVLAQLSRFVDGDVGGPTPEAEAKRVS